MAGASPLNWTSPFEQLSMGSEGEERDGEGSTVEGGMKKREGDGSHPGTLSSALLEDIRAVCDRDWLGTAELYPPSNPVSPTRLGGNRRPFSIHPY